jgi:hypothetical protein
MAHIIPPRDEKTKLKEKLSRPLWSYYHHDRNCTIFKTHGCSCGLLKARDQEDNLLRRAAELLRQLPEQSENWRRQYNDWLKDMEEK